MNGAAPGRIGVEPARRHWADALPHGDAEFTKRFAELGLDTDPVPAVVPRRVPSYKRQVTSLTAIQVGRNRLGYRSSRSRSVTSEHTVIGSNNYRSLPNPYP